MRQRERLVEVGQLARHDVPVLVEELPQGGAFVRRPKLRKPGAGIALIPAACHRGRYTDSASSSARMAKSLRRGLGEHVEGPGPLLVGRTRPGRGRS